MSEADPEIVARGALELLTTSPELGLTYEEACLLAAVILG